VARQRVADCGALVREKTLKSSTCPVSWRDTSGWSGQLFKLTEGWLSSGIIAPALAPDGADLGLCEDLANFWQMTFSVEGRELGKARMTA
jgi:hypothetical protein